MSRIKVISFGAHLPNEDEDKVVDIDGPQGDSVFYLPLAWALGDEDKRVEILEHKFNEILKSVRNLDDDRLLVLVGALVVENAIDELLASIMPGYKSLRDKREFTFSMRIEIIRALRLIPSKILSSADFVRKIRNSFVHDLSIDSFSKMDPSEIQSLKDRLISFNIEFIEDNVMAFSELVLWIAVALHIYTCHTANLNTLIRDDRFLSILRDFSQSQ